VTLEQKGRNSDHRAGDVADWLAGTRAQIHTPVSAIVVDSIEGDHKSCSAGCVY
jgi:hypothetical protein